MTQIENPSETKLSLLLIPVAAMFIIALVLKTFPVWAIVVACAFFLIFLAALTYCCVKQKCYRQLALNYIFLIVFGISAFIQFWLIPR